MFEDVKNRINESSLMTLDEMREYRTSNPYQVIDKDSIFTYNNVGKQINKLYL